MFQTVLQSFLLSVSCDPSFLSSSSPTGSIHQFPYMAMLAVDVCSFKFLDFFGQPFPSDKIVGFLWILFELFKMHAVCCFSSRFWFCTTGNIGFSTAAFNLGSFGYVFFVFLIFCTRRSVVSLLIHLSEGPFSGLQDAESVYYLCSVLFLASRIRAATV